MEVCFLSNLNAAAWAAWVQAGGSVGALFVATYIARLGITREHAAAKRLAAEADLANAQALSNIACELFNRFTLLKSVYDSSADDAQINSAALRRASALDRMLVDDFLRRLAAIAAKEPNEARLTHVLKLRDELLQSHVRVVHAGDLCGPVANLTEGQGDVAVLLRLINVDKAAAEDRLAAIDPSYAAKRSSAATTTPS